MSWVQVTVLVGDPIIVDDLVRKYTEEALSKAVLYDAIALRIEGTMFRMKKELEELVVAQSKSHAIEEEAYTRVPMAQKVQNIWQYADWESQGFLLDGTSRHVDGGNVDGGNVDSRNVDGRNVDGRFASSESSISVEEDVDCAADVGELRSTDNYREALINRIQSRMDPSMFMGFAARGLWASRSKLDDGLESLSRRYRRQMSALESTAWHTC